MKVKVIKGFAALKVDEVYEVESKGVSAYKVKMADGITVSFLPITHGEEVSGGVQIGTSPLIPSDPSEEERALLKNLLEAGGIAIDSGVTPPPPTPQPPSLTPEEVKVREAAALLAKKRSCLVKPAVCIDEYQFKLTDLTDGRLPKSQIDHTMTSYPPSHWGNDVTEDIPSLMEEYYWDPDVLEALHLAVCLNEKVLVTGLPGTGKTTGIKQLAHWINQPYMRFNGKDGVEQSSFLGTPWATSSGMEWKDGLLPIGCKGGYLVCIDEVFKIPAGIQMAMQNLYEKDGTLLLDDKPGTYHEKLVIPAPEFRLMLTDNVRGIGDNFEMFASTQMQDTSTLDRFGITIEQDYLPPSSEEEMLRGMFPTQKRNDISNLVKLAGLVRAGYKGGEISLTLSPRGLMATLRMMETASLPVERAIDLAFCNKLADDSEIQAVSQMRDAVGGV